MCTESCAAFISWLEYHDGSSNNRDLIDAKTGNERTSAVRRLASVRGIVENFCLGVRRTGLSGFHAARISPSISECSTTSPASSSICSCYSASDSSSSAFAPSQNGHQVLSQVKQQSSSLCRWLLLHRQCGRRWGFRTTRGLCDWITCRSTAMPTENSKMIVTQSLTYSANLVRSFYTAAQIFLFDRFELHCVAATSNCSICFYNWLCAFIDAPV